jgi:hypothetical protein
LAANSGWKSTIKLVFLSGQFTAEKNQVHRAIIFSLAAVAQLDRVLGYEPRGRGFNSCQPHQKVKVCNLLIADLFLYSLQEIILILDF